MVSPTSSGRVTYETLYDVTITGGVAASIRANAGEDDNRKLLAQEVAEITEIQIVSPLVAATGAGEALEQIIPRIDGKLYLGGDQVIIRADLDSLFAPPKPTNRGEVTSGPNQGKRTVFKLGTGLPDLAGIIDSQPWRIAENTTIKTRVEGKIDFEFLVGNTAIIGDFRIIAKGWRYNERSVIEDFMRRVYGTPRAVGFVDPLTRRDFSYIVPAKTISADKFTELIGGEDQPDNSVNVKRLLRWARNSRATTPNTDFILSFEDNNVDTRDQDMKFTVDPNNLIVVNRVGVRPGTNHLFTKAEVNTNRMMQEETVPDAKNDLFFGRDVDSAIGAAITVFLHKFQELPHIQPITISNETGQLIFRDDGTAIADGTNFGAGSLIAIDAIQVFDPNFARRGQSIQAPPISSVSS